MMPLSHIGSRAIYGLIHDENKAVVGVAIRRERYVIAKIKVLADEGEFEFSLDEVPVEVYQACKTLWITHGQGEFKIICAKRSPYDYANSDS